MKKILLITSNISFLGGTERAISNFFFLCHEIASISILSICSTDSNHNVFGIPQKCIVNLHQPALRSSLLGKITWYIDTVKKVNQFCKNRKFDIVLTYGHNLSVMSPYLKIGNAKKYACEHINYDSIPFLSRAIMKLVYPKLYGIIVLSSTAKKKLSGLNSNIIIIPNSISFTSDVLSKWNNKRLIMIGRLSPEKGYERLIPIAKYIQEKHSSWKIDIFGEGSMHDILQNQFDANGLSSIITLKGNTNNVKAEILESDILLMTSYTEALPMSVIEAKVLGVPSIAYRCEGTEELICNGNDGFVVDTLEAFLECLEKLITDNPLLKNFGMNAHTHSLSFSSELVKDKWISLFNL